MKLARAVIAGLLAAVFATAAGAAPPPGAAWAEVARDADLEAAFGAALASGRPVLLYWGADWCPPCHHLNATLFNRQDFAERARSLVPVHLDGDAPGAQRLGARFNVRGYPTLILLSPQGRELTRIVGAVDALQVLDMLELGMSGGRPLSQVWADARAGRPLAAGEWRALAFSPWSPEDDEGADAAANAERARLAARLARDCPPELTQARERLLLLALALGGDASAPQPAGPRDRLLALLGDPAAVRRHSELLSNAALEITRAAAPGPAARRRVVAAFDAALRGLQADVTLARADRLSALLARVELARLEVPEASLDPPLPAGLRAEVRQQVDAAERETRQPDERSVVIPLVAHLLRRSGALPASTALLEANLAGSRAPYYLMLALASNARAAGDKAAALDWYQRAYERSVGDATRLQWGAAYVAALVDLAPQDLARLERAVQSVLAQAKRPDAFHGRSARSLQRISARLAGHAAAAPLRGRLQAEMRDSCAALPAASAERETCDRLFLR